MRKRFLRSRAIQIYIYLFIIIIIIIIMEILLRFDHVDIHNFKKSS